MSRNNNKPQEQKVDLTKLDDEALFKLAQERGIVIENPADTTREAVIALIEEKEKVDGVASGDGGAKTTSKPAEGGKSASKAGSSKGFFYWLKTKSYVSDNEIWGVGLYHTAERIVRLDKSPIKDVEIFEGEITERSILEIAKMFKVKVESFVGNKRVVKSTEEILEELVQEK